MTPQEQYIKAKEQAGQFYYKLQVLKRGNASVAEIIQAEKAYKEQVRECTRLRVAAEGGEVSG